MKNTTRGFTLIEIMGGLLVIGILTAIAIPTVITMRRNASATMLYKLHGAIKSDIDRALAIRPTNPLHFNLIPSEGAGDVRYNSGILVSADAMNGATLDLELQALGIIDRPYRYPFSNSAQFDEDDPVYYNPAGPHFRTVSGTEPTSINKQLYARSEMIRMFPALDPSVAEGRNFRLTPGVTGLTGLYVFYIVIPSIDARDAYAIAEKFKPAWLELPAIGTALSQGQVAYAAADTNNRTTVYIYLGHY